MVAYVNIGSYYIIGIPMGILLGWLFNLGVLVRLAYTSYLNDTLNCHFSFRCGANDFFC
jgi:hypothetical protein